VFSVALHRVGSEGDDGEVERWWTPLTTDWLSISGYLLLASVLTAGDGVLTLTRSDHSGSCKTIEFGHLAVHKDEGVGGVGNRGDGFLAVRDHIDPTPEVF
jgi:hypothetical protein